MALQGPTVDGFERAGDDRRLDVVHAARDDDGPCALCRSWCPSQRRRRRGCSLQSRSSSSSPRSALGLAHDGPDDVLRWTVPFTLISARISYFGLAFSTTVGACRRSGLSCFFPCGFLLVCTQPRKGANKGLSVRSFHLRGRRRNVNKPSQRSGPFQSCAG